MKIILFKNTMEYDDLVKKVKKMKKFTEELEDTLEECYEEDDLDFRGGRSYRKSYDDEDMRMEGRYGYRKGGMR